MFRMHQNWYLGMQIFKNFSEDDSYAYRPVHLCDPPTYDI